MKIFQKYNSKKRRGSVLIISMFFVMMFAALAVSMAAMSGNNLQIADNQQKVNRAQITAESGLQVIRYWLERTTIPWGVNDSDRFEYIANSMQSDLVDNYISNITLNYDSSTITIPSVTLDSAQSQNFSAVLQPISDDIMQMDITGSYGLVTRTIRTNYNLEPEDIPIFDYGLATKGPLRFNGNPTITGVNFAREADIYIESQNYDVALYVAGNTNFDGDVSIGNPDADVELLGDVQIGGDHDQTAIDNHVFIGEVPVEFPEPNTEHFRQYATGTTIDSSTNTEDNMTLSNAVIAAGANPTFEGNIIIEGVLFVEMPNIIRFNGNVDVRGLIVANGDVNNPGTNSMTFFGNFETNPFPIGAEFDAIRDEVGSCVLAPGFGVSFYGNFASIGGVMAVNGAHFSGNVNAVVEGTIINYSESPLVVEGNSTLNFDRSGFTEIPAGFEPEIILYYDSESYCEPVL